MKKNISINISGIIFHIEEDAYDKLKNYLDGINRYFSSFDGSHEIIADIESRIAEIFLNKLGEDKQVITASDVESLIATMGNVKDFQAIEEPEADQEKSKSYERKEQAYTNSSYGERKLYRDEQRKLLGGVCAGIAHYFHIDPIWPRLILILLLIGSAGLLLLVYFIMWAVIPGSYTLPEDKHLKKMYRDPEDKVLGGVAKGIANYFGVDVVIIRVLFVLSIFAGGTGLLAYIILWMILPEAKSLTDKMRMQGEPLTLSNIETSIKSELAVKEGDDENLLVKLLLFPFRLISIILTGLGKALGPLLLFFVEFLRIAAGLFLILMGLIVAFSLVVALAVAFGFATSYMWEGGNFWGEAGVPLELIRDILPPFTLTAGFFAIVIPCVFLILLGTSLISKKIVFTSTVGWSLFAVFVISAIVLISNIPAVIFNFREEGEFEITENYSLDGKTAVLTMKEVGMEGYNVTNLKLRGYEGQDYSLVKLFESQGKSRREAIENAQMVDYTMEFTDSIFSFDSNIRFKDNARFRGQSLDLTLYIPYNQKFVMDRDLQHIIRNTIYRNGYRVSDMTRQNIWIFKENGQLLCQTCPKPSEIEEDVDNGNEEQTFSSDWQSYDDILSVESFTAIDIRGAYMIDIEKGNDHKILIKADRDYIDKISRRVIDGELQITSKGMGNIILKDRRSIRIKIITPHVESLDITGACEVYMSDFNERRMKIELTGASYLKGKINVENLELDLTGASEIELIGRGQELDAELTGASELNAFDYKVNNAKIEANAASSAQVNVTNILDIEADFISEVEYRGNPTVRRD